MYFQQTERCKIVLSQIMLPISKEKPNTKTKIRKKPILTKINSVYQIFLTAIVTDRFSEKIVFNRSTCMRRSIPFIMVNYIALSHLNFRSFYRGP